MRILVTTGIYPPKIGGPSQYAKNLKMALGEAGHKVSVSTFNIENYLPTGLRHLWFFVKILPKVFSSDFVVGLDTFSVGLPSALACKLTGKKFTIRTGGDFLWEQYVERTGKKVLFRNFYKDEKQNFSKKEQTIFKLTKWTLKNTSKIVFSTVWQRDIFVSAYGLDVNKTSIIENYYGEKEGDVGVDLPTFVASARDLTWKNLDSLRRIFDNIQVKNPNVQLYTDNKTFSSFMEKVKNCYAVILVSLGDISPNMILDAIRYNKPFICTKEIGIYDRIKDVGVFVDPLNEEEIEQAVLNLLEKDNYEKARQKVRDFTFTHTWKEIADEFISVYKTIK